MQTIQRVKRWTDQEREVIKDNYLEKSDEEIGRMIGRSLNGVKEERKRLGLHRPYVKRSTKKKYPKPTFSDIQEMFDKKNAILLSNEEEYINQNSNMRYICKKHADKGEQSITVYHLKEGKGCYFCGRERTEASRKSKVSFDEDRELCEIKNFEYIKTEIEDGIPYIYFICNNHRLLGIQKMKRGNMNRECVHGCQYCAYKNLPHWYVKYMIETNYDIEVLSEYHGMNKNMTCRCKIHNEIFTTLAKYVYHEGNGCEQCTHDKLVESSRLSLEEVRTRILNKNPDVEILNLDDYSGWETKMRLRCKHCGAIWESPFYSIVYNSGRCPICQKGSWGEQKVAGVLDKNNVMFIPQYKFDGCRGDQRPLPFDFAILDSNERVLGLIEYNGEQHYHSVEYFGGEKKFKKQLERDKIKDEYCKNNNIPFLVIPYWDFDNIEELVTNFINMIL